MKTHLNTLFVTTEGAYLAKQGEAVAVRKDREVMLRVPLHMLSSIVCFGPVGVSPYLLGHCGERGVAVSFMTPGGRFLARAHGFTSGNVLLRKDHFRRSEDPGATLRLAQVFVRAKIHNCRILVLRSIRDHGDEDGALETTAAHLERCLRRAGQVDEINVLRGVEGEAARHYFGGFQHLIRNADDTFKINGRSRRPPRDPVNSMLSFVYALLASDARGACESVGLDPQVGFLHSDRPGRPGLALDLMEELRPVIADRVVLSLINRQQVKAADFRSEINGAWLMKDETRKTMLTTYQNRKQEELHHPFLGEKITLGLVPLLQARLLARTIRGELDAYPAYLWR
jgi:CRISP-associated protein Cas1